MDDGEIVWAVKRSLTRYIRGAGGTINSTGGAWEDEDGRFHFPLTSNPDEPTGPTGPADPDKPVTSDDPPSTEPDPPAAGDSYDPSISESGVKPKAGKSSKGALRKCQKIKNKKKRKACIKRIKR